MLRRMFVVVSSARRACSQTRSRNACDPRDRGLLFRLTGESRDGHVKRSGEPADLAPSRVANPAFYAGEIRGVHSSRRREIFNGEAVGSA